MDNSVNFKGGFLIKSPSTRLVNNIKTVLPKRKCIVENINENGDFFFSTKTCYDRDIAKYILSKRFEFVYYPDINLKTRIDAYFPEEARKTVESQTNKIDNRRELKEYIKSKFTLFSPPKYFWKEGDYIEQTLKALNMDKKECIPIVDENNITTFYDQKQRKIAVASPNGHTGANFVYVFPKKPEAEAERLAVNKEGKIIWRYSVVEASDFKNCFMRNVKIDKGRKRPQNNPKN